MISKIVQGGFVGVAGKLKASFDWKDNYKIKFP